MKKTISIVLLALALMFADNLFAQEQAKPCPAITKAGNPCKGKANKVTGYCFAHNPSANRCGALTAKKEPCKLLVKEPGAKCRYHNK
jgi:hypothetical protein